MMAVLAKGLPLGSAHAQDAQVPSQWEQAIGAFEKSDQVHMPDQGGVLFVGSSSIRGWDTARWFPDRHTINRGFGGSQIADVLQHADRIVWKYKPKVIVFYAGDNDIASGKSADRVVSDFRAFAEQCARRLPAAHLIYLPIKPSRARWQLWPAMSDANARIQQLLRQREQFHYVDTATPLLGEDGQPRGELFQSDGLHLNDAGYRLWTRIVAGELTRLSP